MSGETEAQLRARIAELEGVALAAVDRAANRPVKVAMLAKTLAGIGEETRGYIAEREAALQKRIDALEARLQEIETGRA